MKRVSKSNFEKLEAVQRLKALGYTNFVLTKEQFGQHQGRNFFVRGWHIDDGFEFEFARRFPLNTTILVYTRQNTPPNTFNFAPLFVEGLKDAA